MFKVTSKIKDRIKEIKALNPTNLNGRQVKASNLYQLKWVLKLIDNEIEHDRLINENRYATKEHLW